jgi:hypothetical protein
MTVDQESNTEWFGFMSGYQEANTEMARACGSERREPITKEDRRRTTILKSVFGQEILDGHDASGYKVSTLARSIGLPGFS